MKKISMCLSGLLLLGSLGVGHAQGKAFRPDVEVPFTRALAGSETRGELRSNLVGGEELHGGNPVLENRGGLSSGRYGSGLKRLGDSPLYMRYVGARPSKDATKATVTLDVQVKWDDGTGYQLLLDADHEAYGVSIPEDSYQFSFGGADADYSMFEYSIPENASGVLTSQTSVYGPDKVSIQVPPGVYDYFVGNPVPGDGVWIASGFDSRGDDFEMQAGMEYLFVVNTLDGHYDNCVLYKKYPMDMAVDHIISPVNEVGLGSEEVVKVAFKNTGVNEVSSFKVRYTLDDNAPVEEVVNKKLASYEVYEHTFTTKADLSEVGKHVLEVEVILEGDQVENNDVVRMNVWNVEARKTPAVFDFNDSLSYEDWIVVDSNGDGDSWFHVRGYDADNNPKGGFFASYGSRKMASNEYLVTLRPVQLQKGANHISFQYNGSFEGYYENMRVLYGRSSDVGTMTEIVRLEKFTGYPKYLFHAVDLDVAEAGDYYFAFHAYSPVDQIGIKLDNVKIDTGIHAGVPDLTVEQVVLPVSSCGLSDKEYVGAIIYNQGQGSLFNYTLSYSVDGGIPVSQTFTQEIGFGARDTLYFDQTIDLSQVDKLYEVKVSGVVNEGGRQIAEDSTLNNENVGRVRHYTPAGMPFLTDFGIEEQREDWASYKEDAWKYEDFMYYAYYTEGMEPLVSRCFEMKAGKDYRFTFNYQAGMNLLVLQLTESFEVKYGISGTDMAGWKTIVRKDECYTQEKFVEEILTVSPEADGLYSMAIVPIVNNKSLYVRSIMMEEILDYDVCMDAMETSVIHQIPLDQVGGKKYATAMVRNNGRKDIDEVKVSLVCNGRTLGSATTSLGAPGSKATVKVEYTLPSLEVGDKVIVKAVATIPGHESDDTNLNHEMEKQGEITREVMAYDYVEDGMYTLDHSLQAQGTVGCGLPYTVSAADTLTAISVGWAKADAPSQIVLQVYRWDAANQQLGHLVMEQKVQRSTDSGQIEYKIPALLLNPGDYMVAVTLSGAGLIVDADKDGFLYGIMGNLVLKQTDLGFPAIRAIFGSDGKPVAKDVAVTDITAPVESGIFSANEKIVARITNQGYETVRVPVHAIVNKTALETQTVEMQPYSVQEVVFVADLSQPETDYLITIHSELEGDVDRGNDTCSKTVHSVIPADPYVMDFESCADFAINNFNPAWTTYDGDKYANYGFQGSSFPHMGDAFAFIAFNPKKTEPSLEGPGFELIAPYQGERFGGSFASEKGVNDDWLISPKLMLPYEGAQIEFYVKSYVDTYGLERYNVLVSTTDAEIASFERVGAGQAPADAWTKVNVDLGKYAGKEVYIAIQCVSQDAFLFMVDDIRVSKPTAVEGNDVAASLSLYPNPASEQLNIVAGSGIIRQVSIFNLSGVEVYSRGSLETGHLRLDVSSLPSGMYFARVSTGKGVATMKFVVR